jgi:hypothetical protein
VPRGFAVNPEGNLALANKLPEIFGARSVY